MTTQSSLRVLVTLGFTASVLVAAVTVPRSSTTTNRTTTPPTVDQTAYRASGRLEMANRGSGRLELIAHRASGRLNSQMN
jgi:hypothetical protein